MAHRLTQNWLVGLTRHPALVQRFPFLKTLAHNYRVKPESCSACGQKAVMRAFTDQVNETAKILATIPETEIAEFKLMAKVDELLITYVDLRGSTQTITR